MLLGAATFLWGVKGESTLAGLIIRRLFHLIILLIGISFIVFMSMHIAPGDPATIIAGPSATESDLEAIRSNLGLDRPVLVQYFDYLWGIMQGDLGYSYQTSRAVSDAIAITFPNTIKLAIASIIIAIVIGLIAGIISAVRQNSWFDASSTTLALAGISIPNFWLGTMLILL